MRTWKRAELSERCGGSHTDMLVIGKGDVLLEIVSDETGARRVRCVPCAVFLFSEQPPAVIAPVVSIPAPVVREQGFVSVRASVIDFKQRQSGDAA